MAKRYFFFNWAIDGQSPVHDENGHVRVTKMDGGVVTGGKQETHEELVEKSIKLQEELDRVDRKYGDELTREHVEDAFRKATED